MNPCGWDLITATLASGAMLGAAAVLLVQWAIRRTEQGWLDRISGKRPPR